MKIFGLRFTLRMPKGYDLGIHIAVIALCIFGTLMVTSTSVGETYASNTVVIKTIVKQLVFVVLSYVSMCVVANNFELRKIRKLMNLIGFVILVLLLACFFFDPLNGAQSWIRFSLPGIGIVTLQPSEFMKVFMIVEMANLVEIFKDRRENISTWDIIKVPVAFYAMAAILILLQNDTGSLVVLTMICFIGIMIPTHPQLAKLQRNLMILFIVGVAVVLFFMSNTGIHFLESLSFVPTHIVQRFQTAANPWSDPDNSGYQLINSLYAFATGGWMGLGFGKSIQKMMYLPEAQTDYILAITVEEWGIFGFIYILAFYATLTYRLFYFSFKCARKDSYRIILIGTAFYLFIHFVLNVGGVTGLVPLTGVPLLFISSGSSSLLSICVMVGIAQACIAKIKQEKRTN